ncbi:FAD-binding oxidoreductase [Micromonospora sp. CPCC 206061]|uniref:FAD-binding oxidoreductase n=1 Tax=Micromonospora sp. CPCC 206061 TaxID=3122410 RepID=UPI002FEF5489
MKSADVTALRRDLAGQVLLPDDAGYDGLRTVWNAMVDRRPAVIVRCASASAVATAIRFARAHGLEIGVRCGGHSVAGMSVPDGGLMLDLTPMAAVRVDPERRRAWAQGGALLGAVDRATQPFGLATTAGNVSHTGVGGLTLGGGMGWLARRHGLTCDNVVSFELVTADGERVRATDSDNSDLFWGLRGGGGNFGVVTDFEFRLHHVGTAALVADLYYPAQDAATAMRAWRDLIPYAPRRATLTAWAGTAGPWPFLPSELHHRSVVSVGLVWVGDPDEGREQVTALRAATPAAAEWIRELSYLELQTMDDDREGHHQRRYWKGHYLRALDDAAIDAFVARGAPAGTDEPALLPAASLQAYGGAIADVADDDTAFAHRGALVEFVASAAWTDPAEDEIRMANARSFGAAIEPFASGAYVNALADEGEQGVRRAYGAAKLARLGVIKHRYDPNNVFHLNHNIPPITGG